MKKITLLITALVAVAIAAPALAATYSNPVGFVKVDAVSGFNMIANPMDVDGALNDAEAGVTCLGEMIAETGTGGLSAGSADVIYRYDSGTGLFSSAFLLGTPFPHALDGKWVTGSAFPTVAECTWVLEAGEGFYYKAVSAFTWTIDRPFTLD